MMTRRKRHQRKPENRQLITIISLKLRDFALVVENRVSLVIFLAEEFLGGASFPSGA